MAAGTVKARKTKSASGKKLVIVESPSKAKTIGKYLGSSYKVIASVGHVRDLPKSKLGIDVENNFEPNYIAIRGKGELIKELKSEAKKASKVYLATDPDREGEAISWHLAYLLGIDPNSKCRIEFNEITKNTVKESLKHPRAINQNLVDAQQARRVLDRLVGYQISPLLWRKVRRGLSAGRVQSAALRIICAREQEIRDFVPEEYWTIIAGFDKGKGFTAKLINKNGKKFVIHNEAEKDKVMADLKSGDFTVSEVKAKDRSRKPFPPFTTSSMQQEASIRLNFTTSRTMRVAQQLYEGVEVKGHGTVGLITYLRTDSVRISSEARGAAKDFIENKYGDKYYGNQFYSNSKNKDIQDAHEAIRPSIVDLAPEEVKGDLTSDQFKLYRLIWNRFMASQMSSAKFSGERVLIDNGEYTLSANGSKLLFDGYMKVYKPAKADSDTVLPELEEGEKLKLSSLEGEQNFTQPPARFTEASLIKELEDKNIGRPSTYAPIVNTLTDRKYVKREKRTLFPTELGETVDNLMKQYFKDIVDVNFTAGMEDQLDKIELTGNDWKGVISDFYGPFEKELKVADDAIEKVQIEDRPTDEVCEICGRPMVIKTGRFGDFLACSGYPECKNTKPIVKKVGVKCPNCGKDIVERKSKRGRIFYGCSGYPECSTVFWYRPVDKKCPKCGSLLLKHKTKDAELQCSNPECDYKE
ncbi:MAG: type I DNA topoisomerase [Eubacteriales bacterium]|nr:type I DNA topoisomerase [Eubacteriales bacterium]